MKKYLGIVFLFLLSLPSLANHIVGGEIFYDYLDSNRYRITLKIYRDCNSGVPFDGTGGGTYPCAVTVYDASNNLIGVYDMGFPEVTPVPPAFNNPCIQPPTGTCIEEGLYTYTLALPPQTGGYTLIYQRCCRTAGIANLINSVLQGSTYYTHIPGPEQAADNSSPRFTRFPPIYICNGIPFTFDHSAVDPDGDQLVYSLSAPYLGLDGCCPSLGIVGTPMASAATGCPSPPLSCPSEGAPPPYNTVSFASPFSGTYPIASNPAFSINPQTGLLVGTPTLIAQYVVGVQVQEYRNNVLINTHFRDFQFTVVVCTVTALSLVADQKQQCLGQVITFTNQSITDTPSPTFHWDFGVPDLGSDTSDLVNPTYNYPDTGIYVLTLVTNPGKPCADTLKKPVAVYPPLKVDYTAPGRQCFKNNSFDFAATGTVLPQTSYQWNFTSQATPSVSALKSPGNIHFLESGLFYVKVKAAQFACRDSFTDTIRVVGRANAKIKALQNNLCDPAWISFSDTISSDLPVSYTWNFGNGKTSTSQAPTQLFTPAGNYTATLILQTTQLCNDTFVTVIPNIHVNPTPRAAFSFTPKEASIFEPDIHINNSSPDFISSLTFDFGDGYGSNEPQNIHSYADYGNYLITEVVMNSFGCGDTVSNVVKILPEFTFWVPNTFTPDGNVRNDFFMPVMMGVSNYEFEVFNRWGQEIFHTTNAKEGWNGTFKGQDAPQDVYAWKVTLTTITTHKEETHTGLVTLLRDN